MSEPLERDPRAAGFGLAVAAGGFLVGVVVSNLASAAVAAATGASPTRPTLATFTAGAVGLWVGFLGVPLVAARRRGGVRRWLALRVRPLVDVPLGVAAGLASTFATGWVSNLVLDAGQRRELEDKAGDVIDRAQHPAAVALLVLVLCVATPVAEEVFFRGLLFRSLWRLGPVAVAVVADGIVFGLVHFSGGSAAVVASQLGLLAAFGVVLCVLTWRTGRLGAAVMAHATFNLVTVVAQLAQR